MSENQFYCSDRIKDLIDLEKFNEQILEKKEEISFKIFGDFFSYSRQKNSISICVDKFFVKSLIMLKEKEFTYSYAGIKFFLNVENLEILKNEEKFLISANIVKFLEEDSYE